MKPILLGVNVDHIATLRQARGTRYPDPVFAALRAEMAGADSITVHLREDRRHIQDDDVMRLKHAMQSNLNFEMAATRDMVRFALKLKPEYCCLVPEKREELTTEGGLDVSSHLDKLKDNIAELKANGIQVSLFVDPENRQLEAAKASGADIIELHTGNFADAESIEERALELKKIEEAAHFGDSLGLVINAGHGLHYHNVQHIAQIPVVNELNIGHSIIAQAAIVGIDAAVGEMKKLMKEARLSA